MVVEQCTANIVIIFVKLLVFLVKHWGWTLTALIAVFLLRKMPFVLAGLATALDFLNDTALSALFGLGVGLPLIGQVMFGAGIAVLAVTLGSVIGLFWCGMVWSSKANLIIRILAMPGAFLLGVILTILPWFSAVSHLAFDYAVRLPKNISNVICFIPSAILVILIFFLRGFICDALNAIMAVL